MRKITAFIFGLLLLAGTAHAIVIGFSGPPVDPGATYLLNEDFEGTGTPTGWTIDAGTPDFDYTTSPLEGVESFQYYSGGNPLRVNSESFTGISSGYIGIVYRMDEEPSSSDEFLIIRDGSNSNIGAVQVNVANNQFEIEDKATSTVENLTSTYTVGADYYIKVYYSKGSGTDATWSLWVSTDGTTWGSPATISTGGAITDATYLRFECNYVDLKYVFDDVRVSENDFDY